MNIQPRAPVAPNMWPLEPKPIPTHTAHTVSPAQSRDYVYKEGCSLIVNYLPQNVTGEELHSIFSRAGQLQSCKVMLDPQTKISKGFGFVNFFHAHEAEAAIRKFNGMPLHSKTLKVSFARPSSDEIKNTNVYVSGLPEHFTQANLETLFSPYGKIITSTLLREQSGKSRGQGLVRFNVKSEADAAIGVLNETVPEGCSEPIAVRYAYPPTNKTQANGHQMMSPATSPPPHVPQGPPGAQIPAAPPMMRPMGVGPTSPPLGGAPPMGMGPTSPPVGGGPMRAPFRSNMRFSPMDKPPQFGQQAQAQQVAQLYVCPLDEDADDIDLYRMFSPYGAIQSARVIKDADGKSRGFGFVNMTRQEEAMVAVQSVNGAPLKGKPIQVSFKTPRK